MTHPTRPVRGHLPVNLRALLRTTCAVVLLGAWTGATAVTFSVDVQGPTAGSGVPDSFTGTPIFGTDVLTPFPPGAPGPNAAAPGPLPPPGLFIANPARGPASPPVPGLIFAPTPLLGAVNGWGELDALSYGHDPLDVPFPDAGRPMDYAFSVDEFAIGLPGSDVRLEGALGNQEASADVFIQRKPALPMSPNPGTNTSFIDGNGVAPPGTPGLGLVEPNQPTPLNGGVPGSIDPGDNLDALDLGTTPGDRAGPLYFSLDTQFVDPLEAPAGAIPIPNYGTAAANGFVGGDVLVGVPAGVPGGPIALYAAAAVLGLDVGGADSDDLDALKLAENAIAGYQPSVVPFDWLTGATDMLLYSVRRGSAVIGRLDSIFGIAIEEGDVLTTPCPAGTVLPSGVVCAGGGLPGIFTAAEFLGLTTVRSGTAASYGIINPAYGLDVWADDLDALDQIEEIPAPGTLVLLLLGMVAAGARRRQGRAA